VKRASIIVSLLISCVCWTTCDLLWKPWLEDRPCNTQAQICPDNQMCNLQIGRCQSPDMALIDGDMSRDLTGADLASEATIPFKVLDTSSLNIGDLRGIWGSDATHVWAVSTGGNSIIYWDGNLWTTQNVGGGFYAIYGFDRSNVWVVGANKSIYQWNGSAWVPNTVSNPVPTPNFLSVWGSSVGNLWAVGNAAYRWNGIQWGPGVLPSVMLRGIWGLNASSAWRVGDSGGIEKWNGSSWSSSSSSTVQTLRAVWGSDLNNVYAVGDAHTIIKWNGTSWTEIPYPNNPIQDPTIEFNAIWGTSADNIWVAGSKGTILHWNGSTWTQNPISPTIGLELFGIWGSDSNDIWIIGAQATLLHRP